MKRLSHFLMRLHRCERGAEGLEKLMIIAAIVLPLLGLLIYFRDYITDWMGQDVLDVRGDADAYDPQSAF